MKIKHTPIFFLILLNVFYFKSSGYSATKNKSKTRHSFSVKRQNKTNNRKLKAKTKNITQTLKTQKKENNTFQTQTTNSNNKPKQTLSPRVCDSKYMRCMNKFCSNDKLGKCLCYEDNYTNKNDISFINLDGIQIKKGFDLLNHSKKQCTEILDQCIDEKRGIELKYKNFIQRDCLLLSDKIIEKGENLVAELKELETCLKPYCTVKGDFLSPNFSLCFDETIANFNIDAYCSNIIKKSPSPLALKSLLFDKLALLRERSCIAMDGRFTNNRKDCFIKISYGESKDTITSTKEFKVGDPFICSASTFAVKLRESLEAKQERVNAGLKIAATAFNTAGAALGVIGGVGDPIGAAVSTVIDATETVTDIGLNAKRLADGEMSKEDFIKMTTKQVISTSISLTGTAASLGDTTAKIAGKFINGAGSIGMGIVDTGLTASECAKAKTDAEKAKCGIELSGNLFNTTIATTNFVNSIVNYEPTSGSSSNPSSDANSSGSDTPSPNSSSDTSSNSSSDTSSGSSSNSKKNKALNTMALTQIGINGAIDISKGITSTVINRKIRKEQEKEESLGINKHSYVDKTTGKGQVRANTATNHGNCFINNEFFATENDQYLLLWRN